MITLTALVDKEYIDYVYKNELVQTKALSTLSRNLHVLTDVPSYKDFLLPNTLSIEYPNKVWTYIDKIRIPFLIAKERNQGVLWIDSDKGIVKRNYLSYQGYNDKIIITEYWNEYEHFINPWEESYNNELIEYFKVENFNYKDIPLINEHCFYIPPNLLTPQILEDIQIIGTILEYQSIKHRFNYESNGSRNKRVGNKEGILFGYLIKKHNLPYECLKL